MQTLHGIPHGAVKAYESNRTYRHYITITEYKTRQFSYHQRVLQYSTIFLVNFYSVLCQPNNTYFLRMCRTKDEPEMLPTVLRISYPRNGFRIRSGSGGGREDHTPQPCKNKS